MPDIEEMKRFFDERAGIYDRYMFENIEGIETIYRECARCIKPGQGQSLLDLGCGTGLELTEVFKTAPDICVTGIDLSENMLKLLKDRFTERKDQIRLIAGSYLDMDLGSRVYDCALSVMSLHHYVKRDKIKLYGKIYAALKTGGAYIEGDYTVPDMELEQKFLAEYRLLSKEKNLGNGLYHIDIPFTPGTQAALLKRAGFKGVRLIYESRYASIFYAVKGTN